MASSDVSRSAVIRGLRNIEGERGASSNMVGVAIASYNSSGRSSAWYFAWYWCHPTVELTCGVHAVCGRYQLVEFTFPPFFLVLEIPSCHVECSHSPAKKIVPRGRTILSRIRSPLHRRSPHSSAFSSPVQLQCPTQALPTEPTIFSIALFVRKEVIT